MTIRPRWIVLAVATLFATRPVRAEEERQWEWTDVPRIVAIGDIHGAYDNFVAVLKNAGLVDDKLRWIGGKAHLVQNGDVVDRGPESRKAMDLLMDLQKKAEKEGGYVHPLIGNHEAMNIVGILDLVSKEEFESYTDRDSRYRRDKTFDRYYDDLRREAKEKGEEAPDKGKAKKEFEEKYPLGYIEHRQAFSAEGEYGKWIREHNAAVKINGIVFSHGDWSEKMSALGVAELNRRVRAELSGELPLEEGVTFDAESPLQYRGLAHVSLTRVAQAAEQERVDKILSNLGATRMVVGHTITSGVIESRFGGKHISIDTGMLEIYHGGHRIALEIEGEVLRSIHDLGKVVIPETMDETNFETYLRAVAAVDPDNVDVQLKLVDALNEKRRGEEAAAILERLFERPKSVPFRYRDLLGSYYESQGDLRKAREQWNAYIEGLTRLVKANPENLNLFNLLARFCVDKGLHLDKAQWAIDEALGKSPGNTGFLLTKARVHIALDENQQALEILRDIPRGVGMGYEVQLFSGLAYLGLDDRQHARAAFEEALAIHPDGAEAKEQLKKLDEVSLLR